MRTVRITTLILLFLAWITPVCQGQRPFKHYESVDFVQITALSQDSAGFIWVGGTTVGRFDGYTVKSYRDSSGAAIGDNHSIDASGQLWVSDEHFLHQYVPTLDQFKTYTPLPDSIQISCLVFTPEGNVWVGTFGDGLYFFEPGLGSSHQYKNVNPGNALANNRILSLTWSQGVIMVGTAGGGLWQFDPESFSFTRPPNVMQSDWLRDGAIRNTFVSQDHFWFYLPSRLLKTDKDFRVVQEFVFPPQWTFWKGRRDNVSRDGAGKFWIATQENGLFSFDPERGVTDQFVADGRVKAALKSNRLYAVLVDHQQSIWVGTYDRGFAQLKNVPVVFHNLFLPSGGSTGSPDVLKSGVKEFILMESKGEGLFKAELKADLAQVKLEPAPTPSILSNVTTVNSMLGRDYWWVGTWNHGVFGIPLDSRTGLTRNDKIIRLEPDPSSDNKFKEPFSGCLYDEDGKYLWFFSPWTVLNRYEIRKPYGSPGSLLQYRHNPDDSTSISPGRVVDFIPYGDSTFLVATDFGLDLFNGKTFKHLAVLQNEKARIWRVKVGPGGAIWLGTTVGLIQFVPASHGYLPMEVDALRNKVIAGMEFDSKDRLWLNTYDGIYVHDPSNKTTHQFTEVDGLSHFEGSVAAHAVTSDGYIVFGNAASLVVFDPTTFSPGNTLKAPVFTEFRINNRPIEEFQRSENSVGNFGEANEIKLTYTQDVFTLGFSALDFISADKLMYEYRLDGFDDEWITTASDSRFVTYTNLDPGSYQFQVRVHGSDQVRQLKIFILPPPWRTWWAYTGYWALGIGLLVLARRTIVQRERLKASLSLEKVEREKEHFELEKAKEVDKIKTSFFTNISHEFRTPLTLIKGPVDAMLDRYRDDPEAVKRLKLVQRNSELLLRLINQLLDLAKLESGSLKVEKSAGEVHGFVRAIASGFDSHARQKGVTMVVDVPDEAVNVLFDKDKVETILINLVNNAIKFTPQGGRVSVVATCEASPPAPLQGRGGSGNNSLSSGEGRGEATDSANLTLHVSDTGIGIPLDQREKIFERFHQVSESHKEVGTGIGLSLVKELVSLMGGEISVKSELGKGSEFIVTLPVESAEGKEVSDALFTGDQLSVIGDKQLGANGQPGEPLPITDHRSPITDSRPQILVVEDNADVRAFIIDSLGEEFNYLEAEHGKQGLEKATSEIPDLIISDVMMPEMDGITMAGKIKEDRNTSHIPLILLTAKSTEESKLSGLSSGADDYLTKPFNKQELLLKVRNSINRQNKLKEMLRSQLLTEAPKEKLLSQDEQFLQKVRETIIQQLGDEQLSVESLADDMGMSRVQLYRKVSTLTGMAVNELIRKLRLQRAAQLLGQNWGPVSQVAYEVGFSNLSYFSKVFKEEFGVLPSEYESA